MGGKAPATSFVSGCVLLIVNLASMAAAVMVFALGVWMISSPSSLLASIHRLQLPALTMVARPEAVSAELGAALVLLSCFVFFVAFLGCYGALAHSQFMLFMYSTMVMLLLLLECSLFYYMTSQLIEKWGGGDTDGAVWSAAGHSLRLAFRCCGQHNYTDILNEGNQLPWSCCGVTQNCSTDRVYPRGCSEAISTWVSSHQSLVYTTLAVVHVALSSCSLVRRACIVPSLSSRP